MTYEQAFHTCCRNGLTSETLSFQYNAASPGLDPAMLSAIQSAMTGYQPPRSAPPAPTLDELQDFPVSLRYRPVPGVGPCVSKTAYVGREDRSAGEAGEGRYGNYFTHVVAAVGADRLVPGRRPIELWDSTLWTTREQPTTQADPLDALPSDTTGADAGVAALERAGRIAWLPALLDGVARALAGEIRVVVLDDAGLGWAWIAAASFALPSSIAHQLTFDTYASEPGTTQVLLCATVPGTDRSTLDRKVHSGEVVLLAPDEGDPPEELQTLLGRASRSLCAAGGGARLARIAATLAAEGAPGDLHRLGARIAIDAQDSTALRAGDLDVVLVQVASWLDEPPVPATDLEGALTLVGDAAAELDPLVDGATARAAALMVERALGSDTQHAAVSALARVVLRGADDLDIRLVPRIPPGILGFDAIGQALDLVSGDLEATGAAHRVRVLEAIGLLGVNEELDRSAGATLGACVDDASVLRLLVDLAGRVDGQACAEQALIALAQRTEPPSVSILEVLGRPPLSSVLAKLGAADAPFACSLLAARALVASEPSRAGDELRDLLGRAQSDDECEAAVRATHGEPQGWTAAALTAVIAAHAAVDRPPAPPIVEAGWIALSELDPVKAVERGGNDVALARAMYRLTANPRRRPAIIGLDLAHNHRSMSPVDWAAALGRDYAVLPPRHAAALAALGAVDAARSADVNDHYAIALGLAGTAREHFVEPYVESLKRNLARKRDPRLALAALLTWYASEPPFGARELTGKVLPKLLRDWDDDDRDRIAGVLRDAEDAAWFESWREDNPPRRPLFGRRA